MKKVYKFFIHLFGGYTEEEVESSSYLLGIKQGEESAVREIIEYAKSLYSMDAESWCDAMWKHLIKKCE